MKDYMRTTPDFSLCGLNCCLCPRFWTVGDSRCPGCGGPEFCQKHPSCGVISCAKRHGGVEYCYQCHEFPCGRYQGENTKDSFVTYQNVIRDFDQARIEGIEAYLDQLARKKQILDWLLKNWDNGRQKSFYCLAVNLLPLEALESAMAELEDKQAKPQLETVPEFKERCRQAEELLRSCGADLGIKLELRK